MIHVLFKFAPNPYGGVEIDTTSGGGAFRDLSPFILGPIDTYIPGLQAQNFENLWQFSKVYREHLYFGAMDSKWFDWRDKGWANPRAIRYPMGKGAIPEYSYWNGEKLSYIEARKKIYAPIYAKYVVETESFKILKGVHNAGICGVHSKQTIVLRDYDAYDHIKMGITLKDVINDPNRKCGHAFVLAMILEGVLGECISD